MPKIAIAMLIVIGALVMASETPDGSPGQLPAVLPAASGTLPAEVHHAGPMAVMAYQATIDHPEIVSSVPCLCGCIDLLGHDTNLDCYIAIAQPDMTGVTIYSSHGLYCGVCQLITRDAVDGAARGMSPDALRTMIFDRYGS